MGTKYTEWPRVLFVGSPDFRYQFQDAALDLIFLPLSLYLSLFHWPLAVVALVPLGALVWFP